MEVLKTENINQHEIIEGIRLFRNDVDRIIETYTAEGYSLSFNDDKYKYESLNDYIKNNGYIVKRLTLFFKKIEGDYIGVNTFSFEGNTVTISTDNRIDLFTEIFEHLKKRKPFGNNLLWSKNPIILFLIYLFTVIMVAIPFYKIERLELTERIIDPKTQWYLLSRIGENKSRPR